MKQVTSTICGLFWVTMSRSGPIGKEYFRSRTARSLPGWPGVMFRPRRTTRSLAASNLSWPVPPRTFSSWSRTQQNMPRPGAGGLRNSMMANRQARYCSKRASPVIRPRKLMISCLPAMPLEPGSGCTLRVLGALTIILPICVMRQHAWDNHIVVHRCRSVAAAQPLKFIHRWQCPRRQNPGR